MLDMPTNIPLILALHGFAVMLLGIPFAIGAAMFDKLAEREDWRATPVVTSRATHHWYDPVAHPVRTAHEWRVAHAHPRRPSRPSRPAIL
jgi:hypothetical protein